MQLALCGGYFLVLLDVTVVNVALPSIGTALHASSAGLAWIVDAYTVPLAALLLASGAIGDVLGHRRVVVIGFAGFGLASILGALAPNLPVLAVARAAQGTCAALMLPGTLALLTDSAPTEAARTRAVAMWAAVGGSALPAGPFVGGLLTQALTWRSVFWLNVPVIAVASVPVVRAGRRPGRDATPQQRVDWAGAAALVVVVGAAVTAIIQGVGHIVIGVVAAAVAVVGAAVFRTIERRSTPGLLAVPAGARRPLVGACAVAGLMNLCVLGSLFLITQVFQDVHGTGPLMTGVLLLPAMLPLPLLGTTSGRITRRIGAWRTSVAGLILSALGFVIMARSIADLDYGPLLAGFTAWGAGLGILTPAIVTAAMASLPSAPGAASGASNTARQIGAALGVAAFGAVAGSVHNAGFSGRTGWILTGCAVAFAVAAAAIYWSSAASKVSAAWSDIDRAA